MSLGFDHPFLETIAAHSIKRVAIVDDAFDALSPDSFEEGEGQEFLSAVNERDDLIREFHRVVSQTESDDVLSEGSLTSEALAALWQLERVSEPLKKVLSETLFRVVAPKLLQVKELQSLLKDRLKVQVVETFGTKSDSPDDAFDIAFIDYRFGPSGQQESVDRAIQWAKHLYGQGKTLIVLISAEAEALHRQERFRTESGLTRGLFEFVDKKEFVDDGKICNRLHSICARLDTRHEIHSFASNADKAIEGAAKATKAALHAMGLEDYAYLEQISLSKDGHPLGDYMLWLFGEYFAHALATDLELQPARQLANGLRYERFLPLQRPPSVMLAEMYSAAITEPVHDGWNPHPRYGLPEALNAAPAAVEKGAQDVGAAPSETTVAASEGDSAAAPNVEVKKVPLYQLGDLLIADKSKPAFLVLNAGCDLQFSPDPNANRDCDLEQSILLLPGTFEPLDEHNEETKFKRTELFELDGERFRIVWKHTRAIAVPYQELQRRFEPQGYTRDSRLKLVYALEIQQHFASQLTRVGIPTPAPVFRECALAIYGKASDNSYEHLGTISDGVIVFHHKGEDQFVLTVDCVNRLIDHVDRLRDSIRDELELSSGSSDGTDAEVQTKQVRRRKYLQEVIETRGALERGCNFQNKLHALPAVGRGLLQRDEGHANKPGRLEIRLSDDFDGQYKSNAPIVVAFLLSDNVAMETADIVHESSTDKAEDSDNKEGSGT